MSAAERRFTFNNIADQYARIRPGYPKAVFETIRRVVDGQRTPRLLEVGAGTGKATVGLALQGFEIVALEPGRAMIEQARRVTEPLTVQFLETTFEEWEPSTGTPFQVVSAAQAWHWIDPSQGYRKAAVALERNGDLAIFGTVAPFPAGAMKDGLDVVYDRHAADMKGRSGGPFETYYTPEGPIPVQIAESGLFDPPRHHAFAWTQSYATADYLELISTFSNHQLLGDQRLSPLLDDLGAVIDAHGGVVRLPCETHLFMARKL